MSYHIYFLQDEEDAAGFLDVLSELNAVVWTGTALKLPWELKDDIKKQMASFFCRYTIIPQSETDILRFSNKDTSVDLIGIEFLVCCKRNALSRTYELGRIYYKKNEDDSSNDQMLLLFRRLKMFMRKHYSYSKNAKTYVAPHFKQKYEESYLYATQLGRPITL